MAIILKTLDNQKAGPRREQIRQEWNNLQAGAGKRKMRSGAGREFEAADKNLIKASHKLRGVKV